MIPFNFSFVDREPTAPNERRADKHLLDKLKTEAPGILAWIIRGCLKYQQMGLCPPEKVRAATEEYRRSEDLLADFLEECCHTEDAAAEVQAQPHLRFFQRMVGLECLEKAIESEEIWPASGCAIRKGQKKYHVLQRLKTFGNGRVETRREGRGRQKGGLIFLIC